MQSKIILNWILPTDSKNFDRMSASVWIRALQIFPYLEELGFTCLVNDKNKQSDISIFVRRQDNVSYKLAKEESQYGSKVVLDLCVNYYDVSEAPGLPAPVTKQHVSQCLKMTEVADAVFCASENITNRAKDFHKAAFYLPDSIDKRHFRYSKNQKDFSRRIPRAIWSGVSTKAQELLPFINCLSKHKIPLRIISEKRPEVFGHQFSINQPKARFSRWRYKSFPRQILRGEFIIAPRDTTYLYNQGHSAFKIGVFMAQGVPALGGDIPSYRSLIGDGLGGKICVNENDFEAEIENMLGDREYFATQSLSAIEKMKPFETSVVAKAYQKVFLSLVNK